MSKTLTKKTSDLSDAKDVMDESIGKKKKVAKKKAESVGKASKKAKSTKPANSTLTGRTANGRFAPGVSGNPNGRPKLPEEFKTYGKEAPARLRAIADDPETPAKVRAEIEKWFAEMTYGKAMQQQVIDANVENSGVVTVAFEGELAKWSE